MAISREAYQALEDIVGSKTISEEPTILDTYNWTQFNLVSAPERAGFALNRPEAVLLPGNTEEEGGFVHAFEQNIKTIESCQKS